MKRFAKIQFNDKQYQLKCDFSLIQKIESRPGITITGVANDIMSGRPSIVSLAWVLYVAFKHNNTKEFSGKKFDEFGELVSGCDPVEVCEAANEIFDVCVPGSKKRLATEDDESGEGQGESGTDTTVDEIDIDSVSTPDFSSGGGGAGDYLGKP